MTPAEALAATLEAEHAAVYVYGVLGGRLSSSLNPTVAARFREAYEAHRARRDQLRSLLVDLGVDAVPAAPAYAVGTRSRSATRLLDEAIELEGRCAEVYAQLVAASSPTTRRWAVTALTDAAVRRLTFGGAPEPFPGAPELG